MVTAGPSSPILRPGEVAFWEIRMDITEALMHEKDMRARTCNAARLADVINIKPAQLQLGPNVNYRSLNTSCLY